MYGLAIEAFCRKVTRLLVCHSLRYLYDCHVSPQNNLLQVLTDPHTGKALVIANQSRNVRSNIKRSVNSAVRAAYRSLAAFFIDLRPK